MDVNALFWKASLEELKCGFIGSGPVYTCLLCGKKTEKGIIYPENGIYYDAERFMRLHIEQEHHSVFDYLIKLDKKVTGLSDHQSSLLQLFYQGISDSEIQKKLGIGSSSTIRAHRFALKEKERQAKIFLVLMELLREGDKSPTAQVTETRITSDAEQKIIEKYLPEGPTGPLTTFNIKEKSRLIIIKELAKRFATQHIYTEKEVNEILQAAYTDFTILRRYLIDYGLLQRKPDGSQYWLAENSTDAGEEIMDRKRQLKEQYKEIKTEAGIYQIRNIKNGKILLVATPNLKTINGKQFQFGRDGHTDKALQAEWLQFGPDAFVFEILDVLDEPAEGFFDKKEELLKLEQKWLDKLQPFGERGYNKEKTT